MESFKYFLGVAKGSLGELRCQLYLALDVNYILQERFDAINNFALELGRMIRQFHFLFTKLNQTKDS